MKYPHRPTFGEFWSVQGKQCFWITHYLSYPIGAVLAWFLAQIGVSPSTVTVVGSFVAWIGATWVAFGGDPPAVGALWLLLILHFAYCLDCADGVLARATRTTSPFGAILDKVMDAATMILVPGLLGIGAFSRPPVWLSETTYPFIMLGIIASRVLLAVTIWLKDFTVKQADHLAIDERRRNLQWYVRRFIGHTTDTPVFYCLLAGTWWMGGFWEALAGYSVWVGSVWTFYLALSARDVGRGSDQPARGLTRA
jgi:phosphatidylglycerophosphate synthase